MSLEASLVNSLYFIPFTIGGWLAGSIVSLCRTPSKKDNWVTGIRREVIEKPKRAYFSFLMFLIIILFFKDWPYLLIFQIFFFYPIVLGYLESKDIMGGEPWKIETFFFSFLLVQVFLLGAIEGRGALINKTKNYIVVTQTGEKLPVNLLRVIGDVVLVNDKQNKITILSRSNIKSIQRLNIKSPEAVIPIMKIYKYMTERFFEKYN